MPRKRAASLTEYECSGLISKGFLRKSISQTFFADKSTAKACTELQVKQWNIK